MFTGISWQSYLMMVVAASAVYYFYIAVRYFRNDISQWLSGKVNRKPLPEPQSANAEPLAFDAAMASSEPLEPGSYDEYDELEQFISRIQATIGDAARRNADPEELKQYLGLVFQEYPSLKNDGMRPALNELVASECAKSGLTFSETEADRLWAQP